MDKEALSEAVKTIANELEVPAQEVFRIFTEAQAVKGVFGILEVVVPFLVGALVFVYSTTLDWDENSDEVLIGSLFFGSIATLVTLFILLGLEDAFLRLLEPQYMALKDIVASVSPPN